VLNNVARVFTPADKVIQTPNSDTHYSTIGADLRTEPLVVIVPEIKGKRYFSLQFIDMYTFNFHYVGTRTTGNGGGKYLLVGPGWKGEKPAGIKAIIRSETQFAFVLYRTQLYNPTDIDNVKKIQAGYKVQTLSQFLGKPAPAAATKIDFFKPLSVKEQRSSARFFDELNVLLQFCPVHPSETALMARFAKMNIGANKHFNAEKLSPEMQKAVQEGMADARQSIAGLEKQAQQGKLTGKGFGSRETMKNNYALRMVCDVLGIYGNQASEAVYLGYFTDAARQKVKGASHYTVHFSAGQLPPVNAFWSITMYDASNKLLVTNPLNRYLINSPMLPNLKKDLDGGLTLYVQHDSPGKDKEANWLPAPGGEFFAVLRLYWPKESVLSGEWKNPPMQKVD
jgi:hypothetical protein